ncbi:MAG: hypothetical protein HOP27_11445 [Anaerolineales bacterium]|nr:hypothetical protein [Anaerolineales bacterium]
MTFRTPVLPRITNIELSNYQPLFDKQIFSNVTDNRLLVLGGNGLGKTTILQSIIYCVAGESDKEVEADKNKRWGRKFFYGRIKTPEEAHVKVEFYMGDDKLILKRGFRTPRLLEFYLNDELSTNQLDSGDSFKEYLENSCGYDSHDDFRFLVHKLCYLPEDRPNLVWDSENQIRLIMLLFSDIIDHFEFGEKRKQLKNLDSKKRGLAVEINYIKNKLNDDLQGLPLQKVENVETLVAPIVKSDDELGKETDILQHLNNIAITKTSLQEDLDKLNEEYSINSNEIDEIQGRLAQQEEAFILSQFDQIEAREIKLAVHKLLHLRICPVCGEKAEELAKKSQENVENGLCPLCGTKKVSSLSETETFKDLDTKLKDRLEIKISIETSLLKLEQEFDLLAKDESRWQYQYNSILLSKSKSYPDYQELDDEDSLLESRPQQFQKDFDKMQNEHLELERSFQVLHDDLEREYSKFTKVTNERIVRLGQLYESFASAFLGVHCQLDVKDADVRFLKLNLYVPNFNDQIRLGPESCSEAQRFFLDIAFRMSIIEMAKELSGAKGSFVCETPENALDITYIENVAHMFKEFASEGHSLIASGNLQPAGLAGPILSDIPRKQRQKSVLNLLDYGKLSDVQIKNRSELVNVYQNHVLNYKRG